MTRVVLVALLLLATGCGGDHGKDSPGSAPVGKTELAAICPAVHQVYDALVASNPESQKVFVDHLLDLRTFADEEARIALDPLIEGAKELEAAGRGPDFSAAQNAMYAGVVSLDKACRGAGSSILH